MAESFSATVAFIWSVADLLRGDFKQSQYGRVILPFTLLRRLECVLAPTKSAVLAEYEKRKDSDLPLDAILKKAAKLPLEVPAGLGSGRPHDPGKVALSVIIERLNELFAGENVTDKDRLNYMNTIKDKVLENQVVVQQLENNTPDQVMIGDYPNAVQDAVMESLQTHSDLAGYLLQNEPVSREFARLLLDVILKEGIGKRNRYTSRVED